MASRSSFQPEILYVLQYLFSYLFICLFIYLFVMAVTGNSRERSQPSITTFQGERDSGTSYTWHQLSTSLTTPVLEAGRTPTTDCALEEREGGFPVSAGLKEESVSSASTQPGDLGVTKSSWSVVAWLPAFALGEIRKYRGQYSQASTGRMVNLLFFITTTMPLFHRHA